MSLKVLRDLGGNSRVARAAYVIVLVAWVIKMLTLIVKEGDKPLGAADSTAEATSIVGGRNFVEKGFWISTGLPDGGVVMNHDSPSEVILKSPYYAHYLPGPDYVVAAAMAVFGTSEAVWQWTRILPMLHVLFGAMLFLHAAHLLLWRQHPWARAIAAIFLLFPPGMRPWAISLHGHAYCSSYILAGLGIGMLATAGHLRFRTAAIGCFLLGFFSNYMLLTAAFVVCAAPLVGSILLGRDERWFAARSMGIKLSFVVGLGLVAAFTVHFFQVAHQFGLHEAWIDQFGTYFNRASKATNQKSRVQMLGWYSNHCETFWGISSLAMTVIGSLLAWMHPESVRRRSGLWVGLILSGVASYAWIMIIKNHSIGHWHVNPRIFYLMYAAFIAVCATVAVSVRKQA